MSNKWKISNNLIAKPRLDIGEKKIHILTKLLIESVYNNNRWVNVLNKRWPVNKIRENTTYIFVFLGEFGYEIFNWQGAIRKFSLLLPKSSRLIIAGRRGLEAFYESASRYIDISDFEPFRNSVAAAYFAIPPDMEQRGSPYTEHEIEFDKYIKSELKRHLHDKLGLKGDIEFIFSSELTAFPGCIFGVDRKYYGSLMHIGKIYNGFDILLKNNNYKRIEPNADLYDEIGKKLGFSLDEPYVLIQKRSRKIGPQFSTKIDETYFVKELQKKTKVVLLSFDTGRMLDSRSDLKSISTNCYNFPINSFVEQSCLIAKARKCIFFTEGDLGSHTYLPPFMGKDVYVFASASIFDKPSAPIELWNKHIFRFGGQMIPVEAESVLCSKDKIRENVEKIIG